MELEPPATQGEVASVLEQLRARLKLYQRLAEQELSTRHQLTTNQDAGQQPTSTAIPSIVVEGMATTPEASCSDEYYVQQSVGSPALLTNINSGDGGNSSDPQTSSHSVSVGEEAVAADWPQLSASVSLGSPPSPSGSATTGTASNAELLVTGGSSPVARPTLLTLVETSEIHSWLPELSHLSLSSNGDHHETTPREETPQPDSSIPAPLLGADPKALSPDSYPVHAAVSHIENVSKPVSLAAARPSAHTSLLDTELTTVPPPFADSNDAAVSPRSREGLSLELVLADRLLDPSSPSSPPRPELASSPVAVTPDDCESSQPARPPSGQVINSLQIS